MQDKHPSSSQGKKKGKETQTHLAEIQPQSKLQQPKQNFARKLNRIRKAVSSQTPRSRTGSGAQKLPHPHSCTGVTEALRPSASLRALRLLVLPSVKLFRRRSGRFIRASPPSLSICLSPSAAMNLRWRVNLLTG